MLQKLNERIQGVVAWLVVILIGITFTLFGVDYYLQSRQTTNAKVTVNGEPVTMQSFENNYRRARSMQDIEQMTAADEKKLQNQVLDQMVTNAVLVQAALKNGFDVSSNQANAAILNIPQFQEDGHFSAQKYQQALNAALFTQSSFQNEVKQGMLLNQQRFAFMGSSFALPDEIDRFVSLYMQSRDYDYLTVPASAFEKNVHISPAEIASYYKEHKKDFMSPEKVSLDYVTLSMHDIKNQIKVSEDDAKRYYEDNQSSYLIPASWQVAHILFAVPGDASLADLEKAQKKANDAYQLLLKKPDQFDHLVATLSDDKLSVADKGVLPWITAGGQNNYNQILSGLTKPGQISPPEKTKHGYEIFKLVAYKPVSKKSFSEVASAIKEQLINEAAQTKYTQALEQLSDLSYQTPDSLQPVAEALNLKIEQTQPFSRSAGIDAITKNKQIINTAFSHDVLDLRNNSEPIQIDNDSVVVIRVNQHWAEKEQPLENVEDQINKILVKKTAEAKAKEIGMSLLNPVEDKQQQELIHTNNLSWKSVVKSTRDNDKVETDINDVAFNLLRPENRSGLVLPNGDYVVVRLKQIHDGKLSTLDREQQDSLIQQIEASYGMMDYDLYVKSLINRAQIERH
ncbi:SurA N-terminal domain-containing protein [Fluoribacter dumoffii]|uniref:Periplasmic chaperone PpiD n=1 Tax=Fluoribacter dumoffii TaxID=463 RepID=A0A377GA54_9GAMM|nr:SurA N-terminal domain-containing protein [Fluoribacter dumoffii]KTC88805.1 peptidyl-prolyl cis-trans isomerase D [Fluoribacter dumoffii NY 23]MCW8418953.1 SurA N-terminal domain-containing protein [Fluoribacter dumoffii]MCW8453203.1 SurA N-terminal domain-containing protein [Fluoribacter dumoffii]MCW8459576.1 SurA N-terminal domain-containing protein [Fluoribacter dumoffii]MCW8482936.1 SurA N-terminal domain-containing protein [Fluoribacter dumoffii]